ncbi:efflux RND transporter periplasmic adaptor subunit [bacterium]|nr:efflux RND transporter periplasmic adaptor subunit [bacterium]
MTKTRIVLALGFAGLALASASAQPPGFDMAKNVQTGFVQRGGIVQPIRLTGTAEAIIESTIASEQQGAVESVLVDEGDSVTTGTVLLTLRREPLRFARDAARATLAAEQARLTELKTGSRPEDISIAKSTYEESRVAFEVAQRDYTRFKALHESRSVSDTDLDQAKQTFESAKARMENAKATYDLAVQGPRSEEILAQEARVAAALADAELRDDNLNRAEIRAPYAGVVTKRHVNVGTWVADGDPVFDMATLDRLRIRTLVPEQEYDSITVGSNVTVSFDATPEKSYELSVSRVISRADSMTRTFPILINVGRDAGVAPGMLARVEFKRDIGGTTTVIPKDAIVAQGPVPVIFKVEMRDGVPFAKRLEVQTGRFFGQAVEVISDELHPGEQVVIRGNERLSDGDKLALNVFVTNPSAYVADESKFFTEKASN